MNDQLFDKHLKSAFPQMESTSALDSKIDNALGHRQRQGQIRRRLAFSVAGTSLVAIGAWLFPAVKAQASIGGIVSALDRKVSVRVITYSIDEQGHQTPMSESVISRGDIYSASKSGDTKQYELGDQTYVFDSLLGAYIQMPRRGPLRMRLSDMLGSASQFSVNKQVTVVNTTIDGKQVIRVTIKNGDLPERYIIDADPETQLPVHMTVEALERGKWRPNSNLVFDYRDDLSIDTSDLKKHPLITRSESFRRFFTAMTEKTLAQVALKKSNFILRGVEVAQDGTIFVAYQSGHRAWNSWNGYAIQMRDDLGTTYLRLGDLNSMYEVDTVPKQGTIEMEAFVPLKPIDPGTKRKLSMSVYKDDRGELGRVVNFEQMFPDGRKEKKLVLNSGGKGTLLPVWSKEITAPTCDLYPSWANRLNYMNFGNEVYTAIARADVRARFEIDMQNWPVAEAYLDEVLRLKRLSPTKGYSSWSLDSTLKDLDNVRTHLRP